MSTPKVRVGKRVSAYISSEYGSSARQQRDRAGGRQQRRRKQRRAGMRDADGHDDDRAHQRAERGGPSAVHRSGLLPEQNIEGPTNSRGEREADPGGRQRP